VVRSFLSLVQFHWEYNDPLCLSCSKTLTLKLSYGVLYVTKYSRCSFLCERHLTLEEGVLYGSSLDDDDDGRGGGGSIACLLLLG